MPQIKKVAIVGASGNFGSPITNTLLKNNEFSVTIISRLDSKTSHPQGIPVIRTSYDVDNLTKAFQDQDAVVNVLGPAGIVHSTVLIDAALAAGVKRFVINDFGWGPDIRGLKQFDEIHEKRKEGWKYARTVAEVNPAFTWTGITSGNPIDWAMKKFPLMGFDTTNHKAITYDDGNEHFTGTTMDGIAQSVLGVLQHPDETANRFVKVLSIKTCQHELLEAFEEATGQKWAVSRNTTQALKANGEAKHESGDKGWVLDLVVAQLFDKGEGRCVVAPSWEESDSSLLGVKAESPEEIVAKVL